MLELNAINYCYMKSNSFACCCCCCCRRYLLILIALTGVSYFVIKSSPSSSPLRFLFYLIVLHHCCFGGTYLCWEIKLIITFSCFIWFLRLQLCVLQFLFPIWIGFFIFFCFIGVSRVLFVARLLSSILESRNNLKSIKRKKEKK